MILILFLPQIPESFTNLFCCGGPREAVLKAVWRLQISPLSLLLFPVCVSEPAIDGRLGCKPVVVGGVVAKFGSFAPNVVHRPILRAWRQSDVIQSVSSFTDPREMFDRMELFSDSKILLEIHPKSICQPWRTTSCLPKMQTSSRRDSERKRVIIAS